MKLKKFEGNPILSPNPKNDWENLVVCNPGVYYDNGKFYLAALKDKVHIGFAITGLEKQEVELFQGSGKTMRHIKIYYLNDIDEKKITKLMKMVEKKVKCTECRKKP